MQELLFWIEAHPASAYWFQGVAITLTGVCALVAAIFAYRGACKQAQTSISLYEREKDNARKGSSAALAAELISVLFSVQWLRGRLRLKDYEAITRFHTYTKTSLDVFDNDPKIIANLTARTASNVVCLYRDYKSSVTFLVSEMPETHGAEDQRDQLAFESKRDFDLILIRCIKVIDDLYAEAEMDDGGFLTRWIEEEAVALDFPFISTFKTASPDDWRNHINAVFD